MVLHIAFFCPGKPVAALGALGEFTAGLLNLAKEEAESIFINPSRFMEPLSGSTTCGLPKIKPENVPGTQSPLIWFWASLHIEPERR